jgi:hypothetical protein
VAVESEEVVAAAAAVEVEAGETGVGVEKSTGVMWMCGMYAWSLNPGPAMPASAMSLPSMAQQPLDHGGGRDTHLVCMFRVRRAPHQRGVPPVEDDNVRLRGGSLAVAAIDLVGGDSYGERITIFPAPPTCLQHVR